MWTERGCFSLYASRKHVVFGKLITGDDTLRKIERVDVDNARPTVPVKIVNCGELNDHGTMVQENGMLISLYGFLGMHVSKVI